MPHWRQDTDDSILFGLNEQQLCAVRHVHGPLKIVAGAGTGKTGTLTRRFAYLVREGVEPDRILALTYSRRAATEFRERAIKLLDSSYGRLWIETFHAFCLRIMGQEREVFGKVGVVSEAERRRIASLAVQEDPHAGARIYYVGDSGAQRLLEDVLTLMSRTKDEAISIADFVEYADRRGVERLRELANVYLIYGERCRQHGQLDFGDLGYVLIRAFESDPNLLRRWQEKFEHVMVDEFQDTNEVQWRLLRLLAPPPGGNLTVVGDGCQAIYAFRGASSRFFNRFAEEYADARSIVLATNYRSQQNILDVAHRLISCNTSHESHHLRGTNEAENIPVRIAGFASEDEEADYVARSILRLITKEEYSPGHCAVLCRSLRQSARPLIRAFTAYGVPFSVRGYDPDMEEAIEDLCAVLRCVGSSGTWIDAARVLVRRHLGLGKIRRVVEEDALARRYAELLGPNQDILASVPPLNPITYARVNEWLDGAEAWRPLEQVREELPPHLSSVAEALDRLQEACDWLRNLPLEGQVYAALALVGRLDAGSPGSSDARAGVSACRRALRAAHGLARAGLGIPQLIGELGRLIDEETELGVPGGQTGVAVLTLHSAKGLEWPAVFIMRAAAGSLPAPLRLDRAFDLDDLAAYTRSGRERALAEVASLYGEEPERKRAARYMEEERRLAYVGCTRAKRQLTVTFARSYDRREALPSPFIAEMQRAPENSWLLDTESDAEVMLPIDVARAVRHQALSALGVLGRQVELNTHRTETGDTDVVGTLLTAQWTASTIAGGVPIRFRELPRPFVEESTLNVSHTGIEAYRACPRQFFYGHVLHVDAPSYGASTTLGSKVHSALYRLNSHWMETGVPPSDEEVQSAWRDTWTIDEDTIKSALTDPDTRVPWEPGFTFARQTVQGWRRGAAHVRRYYQWERDLHAKGARRCPVALEHAFSYPHGKHIINGRIDCVLRTPTGDVIVDYKTGGSRSDLKAAKSLQLAMYERAWMHAGNAGDTSPQSAYYFLAQEKDRSGNFNVWDSSKQVDVARYNDSVRGELWAAIDNALENISRNEFGAAPAKGGDTCGRCLYSTWCEESQG